MICINCRGREAQARKLCQRCYLRYYKKKEYFIYKVTRPLKKVEIEHNLKLLYKRIKYNKKKHNLNFFLPSKS